MPLREITAGFRKRNLDGTGRLQVSLPTQIFEDRHTYDIGPALWETVDNTNGTVAHVPAESGVSMEIGSTSGDILSRQTYQWFHYTPGQITKFELGTVFPPENANLRTRVGPFSPENGIFFEQNGPTLNAVLRSNTSGSVVDNTVAQSSWNVDPLDGTGRSGLTLDITKFQMIFFRFGWYGGGIVEVGFRINGETLIAHRFPTANVLDVPWARTGTLPFRYEIENTGATGTTSDLRTYGASVITEGQRTIERGYLFEAEGTATAGNGTRAHALSVRPKTTFNGVTNRTDWILESIDIINVGNNPVKYEIGYGHTLTAASFSDVNSTYSASEFDSGATLNTAPAIVTQAGYVPSNNKAGETLRISSTENIIPLTLDASGAVRDLGTVGVFVTGIGGSSDCRAILNWREII